MVSSLFVENAIIGIFALSTTAFDDFDLLRRVVVARSLNVDDFTASTAAGL